ncbi:hypothetical protein DPEC_G00238670 [Dallia pectoralis]|uniref:Uncharacterized protein n=1 Tax=Dallia pectoralis TaxID=75939 RepID=A0ACC2FYR5_DALPE|nr:hypothetical protein DPEC_G00238670 [Dallia pectoralis]
MDEGDAGPLGAPGMELRKGMEAGGGAGRALGCCPEAGQVGRQGETGGSTACSTLRAQQASRKQGAEVMLLPRRGRPLLVAAGPGSPPPAGSRRGEKVKSQSLGGQREAQRQERIICFY